MKRNNYKLSNIDCAACGMKIEDGVSKLSGVKSSNFNFMFMKLNVEFNEEVITDEEIETTIHKPVIGIRIVEKNGKLFEDIYEEEKVFKKIRFKPRFFNSKKNG